MAKKLYVGNLPYNTTQSDLEELFTQAGTVESVNIITDKFSGRSRGFGFVEMASDEEAQAAIRRFDGHELGGRALKVNEARPQGERSSRGRFRNGGGSRGGREQRW